MKTIIGLDEKYDRKNEKRRADRRNEEGLIKREQEKVNTLNEVRELVRNGLKNKDIAEKLKISVRQVQQVKERSIKNKLSNRRGDMKWVFINMWCGEGSEAFL